MSKILLCALNARYHHASFGLRYLYANLGELQKQAKIVEYTISQNSRDIALSLLEQNPEIIGIGVYIWNTDKALELVNILKKISPNTLLVLGGPEVSYEQETQEICKQADFVFKGEADFAFREFCEQVLNHKMLPANKFIQSELPDIKKIVFPYDYYSDEDIRNRIIYVEASRGCPYKCEYCLSSLDVSVRNFDVDLFLLEMQKLLDRGVRQFKFVDRTFNLSPSTSTKILNFFLQRIELGLFLHFELVPDRLPPELKTLIEAFPKGSLQFEIGIQTFNPEVSRLVSRRQDYTKIKENFAYLSAHTKVHTHADLIAGLPGETLESFAKGFDTLLEYSPDEIQVGILKRLKGTPIIRHDQTQLMLYQDFSPFQILQNKTMSFSDIQKIQTFADFWDQVANSGNFPKTLELLREESRKNQQSFFFNFMKMSEYLIQRHGQRHAISMLNLLESLFHYLHTEIKLDFDIVRNALLTDYCSNGKRETPKFLRNETELALELSRVQKNTKNSTPKRQQNRM